MHSEIHSRWVTNKHLAFHWHPADVHVNTQASAELAVQTHSEN